jgi:hypothetical protein
MFQNEKAIQHFKDREEHFGQWFTNDKADLDWYAKDREFIDPEIINLKVPKNELVNFQNYNKALSRATEREFVIPLSEQQKYLQLPGSPNALPIETPAGFNNRVFDSNFQLGNAPQNSHISELGYNYRTVGPEEIKAIQETNGVFPKAGKAKGGNRNVKYWTKGNEKNWYGANPEQNIIRVNQDKFAIDKVVNADDVEIYNHSTKSFEPILSYKQPLIPNLSSKISRDVDPGGQSIISFGNEPHPGGDYYNIEPEDYNILNEQTGKLELDPNWKQEGLRIANEKVNNYLSKLPSYSSEATKGLGDWNFAEFSPGWEAMQEAKGILAGKQKTVGKQDFYTDSEFYKMLEDQMKYDIAYGEAEYQAMIRNEKLDEKLKCINKKLIII